MKYKRFCCFCLTVCFVTRINTQLSEYFSRRPDTEAKFIDTFTVNWLPCLGYLFSPFNLLPRVLQKIQVEQVEVLIVKWSNFELSSTRTADLQTQCNKNDSTIRSQSQTPISRETVTDGGSIIREKYWNLGHSENTRKFISKLETSYTKKLIEIHQFVERICLYEQFWYIQ